MKHLSDETLNEYLDAALDVAQQAEAQAHLNACPACAARLTQFESLFARLESLPDQTLARDLTPAVVAQLERPAVLPGYLRWLGLFQLATAGLALALGGQLIRVNFPLEVPFEFPALAAGFSGLAAAGLNLANSLPRFSFEIPSPGFDLPATTLAIAIVSVSVLWLAGNGLLLNPRSRRHP
jgi:anti-sigma factor RsiW